MTTPVTRAGAQAESQTQTRRYVLEGTMVEACTCEVLCPCWIGEDPDNGTCDSFLAYHSPQPRSTTSGYSSTATLEAANAAVVASLAKSRELGVLSVVAVYDEGGTLKALATMDGARYTGVQFALDKAWTAARRQAATQDLADANANGPEMNWHSFLKQPQTTFLGGGLPIVVDGQVVGGIGSSGGTIAQDTEIATAGLAAIQR
jgi:uncharacterized protein GlcG (DUF336 family)